MPLLCSLPDERGGIIVGSSAAEDLGEENKEQLTGEQHHGVFVVSV